MFHRQQLLSMRSMLDHVAQEAAASGFGLIATLSAAAAEAARDELSAFDRRNRKPRGQGSASTPQPREKVKICA